jgi:hypothetical protein
VRRKGINEDRLFPSFLIEFFIFWFLKFLFFLKHQVLFTSHKTRKLRIIEGLKHLLSDRTNDFLQPQPIILTLQPCGKNGSTTTTTTKQTPKTNPTKKQNPKHKQLKNCAQKTLQQQPKEKTKEPLY